jgi:hypothetical protein
MRGRGEESSSKELPQPTSVQLSSRGSPYIEGWGVGLPLHQGKRAAARGDLEPAAKP